VSSRDALDASTSTRCPHTTAESPHSTPFHRYVIYCVSRECEHPDPRPLIKREPLLTRNSVFHLPSRKNVKCSLGIPHTSTIAGTEVHYADFMAKIARGMTRSLALGWTRGQTHYVLLLLSLWIWQTMGRTTCLITGTFLASRMKAIIPTLFFELVLTINENRSQDGRTKVYGSFFLASVRPNGLWDLSWN
jgi:hypothetical protein